MCLKAILLAAAAAEIRSEPPVPPALAVHPFGLITCKHGVVGLEFMPGMDDDSEVGEELEPAG